MRNLLTKEELEMIQKGMDPDSHPPKKSTIARSLLLIVVIFLLFVLFGCIIASVR